MKPKLIIMLLAGIILLGACKRKAYEIGNDSTADSAAVVADTSANNSKLVKTADIRFKVKNVEQTSEGISALTLKFNGMVTHHAMTSLAEQSHDVRLNNDSVMRVSAFTTSADMTVKIPTEKIDDFLNTVSHMGIYVNERRMDIEDRSLDYLSAQMKLNSRRELIARQKSGKVVIKDPDAVLNLKDDLVDEQINNRRIDNEVKYSVISLNFYQSNTISKEVVANDDPADYNLPFFKRLGMAFSNGWFLLGELVISLMNLWAVLLFGACTWIVIRVVVKRKVKPTI